MIKQTYPLSHVHQGVHQVVAEAQQLSPATHLGHHVLGEFYDCLTLPDDVDTIQQMMEEAARIAGATVVSSVFHAFEPWGLSGVVVLSESHLAIHTWPEHHCAAVDLFTCSKNLHPRMGFDFLREQFGARKFDVITLPRGAEVRLRAEASY